VAARGARAGADDAVLIELRSKEAI